MKSLLAFVLAAVTVGSAALADTATLDRLPGQSLTVTNWYKQSVYDPSNNKIGEVNDVLVTQDGKISALIVSVGGFLGMGEKDVAVPFASVKQTMKDGSVYLTLDTSKDALKAAPGFKYDRSAMTWVPA
jgi:sporulation protein YlmC with PRC-barrel domain